MINSYIGAKLAARPNSGNVTYLGKAIGFLSISPSRPQLMKAILMRNFILLVGLVASIITIYSFTTGNSSLGPRLEENTAVSRDETKGVMALPEMPFGNPILFSVDVSSLNNAALGGLKLQAEWLRENRHYQVIIEGHSDELGSRAYNIALSARRAASVRSALIELGVEAGRIQTISHGNDLVLGECFVEECREGNRRVVTKYYIE